MLACALFQLMQTIPLHGLDNDSFFSKLLVTTGITVKADLITTGGVVETLKDYGTLVLPLEEKIPIHLS